MHKRNALKLAAAGLITVLLGYAGWSSRFASQAEAGAAIVQKPGERGFSIGTLAFSPCELTQRNAATTTAAFCAPFQVPENWDRPDGRRIDLKLALIRSRAAAPELDPVVLLAGGPGQAATQVWSHAAGSFAPLLEHRHVLLLDQRGTGDSHPLYCKQSLDDDTTAADIDFDTVHARTRACLDEVSRDADPSHYTTTVALRDLEAVRQALGAPRLNLVGVSYGTRVAQQYLRRYPDSVRSVVLDSAVPNEQVLGAEFAINLDDALKAQFALCTQTPRCASAFGDPYASLYRLRDALAANPPTVEFRGPRDALPRSKPLDAATLAGVVRLFAYTADTAALLPLAIERGLQHDYAPLLGQADLLTDDLAELSGSGMQLSVICTEDADLLVERPQDAPLLLGDLSKIWRAQCAIWPRGNRPADFHTPIESDKPVLILGGEFDPVTPPRYAQAIAKGLPNSRVLIARGQGHHVMGSGCLPRLVGRFVANLDARHLDAGCIADFAPTPAFTTFNGAAP
ncbi:MAG: alpha/beta hydrolase [Rhodanobacter sp.]|jgi:pimeloyl-ACP methyl ester carboxylesterase|nr:alpha/beta hydrolase [Rhodanobacter sp.]